MTKTFVLIFMICNGPHGECHQDVYRFYTKLECEAAAVALHDKAHDKYMTVSAGCDVKK